MIASRTDGDTCAAFDVFRFQNKQERKEVISNWNLLNDPSSFWTSIEMAFHVVNKYENKLFMNKFQIEKQIAVHSSRLVEFSGKWGPVSHLILFWSLISRNKIFVQCYLLCVSICN